MKAYYYNENKKLFNRIRWSRDLVYFLILLVMFFSFFFFLLSEQQELLRPTLTSLFIAFIITLGIEINYLIENKEYIYIIKKGILYIIMFQNDSIYLDEDFLTSEKLREDITEEKINDIIKNTEKYIGVSILKADKLEKLKAKKNYYSFLASGDLSFWKAVGTFFTVSNYALATRKKKKKFVVTKEYKDYDELLKYLRDKLNSQ